MVVIGGWDGGDRRVGWLVIRGWWSRSGKKEGSIEV